MLMGISLLAILLAKQSAASKIIAPISPLKIVVLKSFLFVKILPIWGSISPIKVISPETQTMLATTKVADKITHILISFTITLKLLLSSSLKESTLICHLRSISPTIPIIKKEG